MPERHNTTIMFRKNNTRFPNAPDGGTMAKQKTTLHAWASRSKENAESGSRRNETGLIRFFSRNRKYVPVQKRLQNRATENPVVALSQKSEERLDSEDIRKISHDAPGSYPQFAAAFASTLIRNLPRTQLGHIHPSSDYTQVAR